MKYAIFFGLFLIVPILGACDPTHADQVAALGDEAPNVRRGPTHRPGQPCLLCHDGAIGDPQQFSVAGTIYQTAGDGTGADGVSVTMTDATGSSFRALTNSAGNFYVTPNQWTPTFPIQAQICSHDPCESTDVKVTMRTLISRDGSCSGCHVDPASDVSPGRVVLTLADGGAPL